MSRCPAAHAVDRAPTRSLFGADRPLRRFRGSACVRFHKPLPRRRPILNCRGQGLSAVLGAEPHWMSVSLGRTTQNSFPQDRPGLSAGLADIDPAGPERKKAVDLLIAVRGAAGEVNMYAVLDRLGIGDRHEAHAQGCVLVGFDDDLVLALGQDRPAPASRTGPERADRERQRRCGGVGRACRRTGMSTACTARWTVSRKPAVALRTGRSPGSRHAIAPRSCDQPDPAAAGELSQLSTWPDGKTITDSNQALVYLCKISA